MALTPIIYDMNSIPDLCVVHYVTRESNNFCSGMEANKYPFVHHLEQISFDPKLICAVSEIGFYH